MNDAQLINDFVTSGSETAFRALVEHHLPLVLGTARRITVQEALAEEVAQTVFILLARRARSFRPNTIVSGWLYRTTCFVAARALRGEQRRKRREQEAAVMQIQTQFNPSPHNLVPHLDDALQRLNRTDRDALLLRFCDQLPLRNVGSNLGLTEEAAKKRVARALEKLRRLLSRRGTEISAAALAAGLMQQTTGAAVTAAAVSQITAAALVPAASSALLADVLAAWRWSKLKMAFGIGSGVVATAILLSQAIPIAREKSAAADTQRDAAPARGVDNTIPDLAPSGNERATIEFAGQTLPAHSLRITVLDAISGEPIAGAEVTHSLMWANRDQRHRPPPLHTGADGTVTMVVPEQIPGGDRMSQFQANIKANNYASRAIMWLCSTGGVLNLVSVSNKYTVRLESGCTLSGTVVDDTGQPLAGVRVGALGNNYRGYSWSTDEKGRVTSPPTLRVEDFSEFSTAADTVVPTGQDGQFQFDHYPTDLKSLMLDLVGTDGSRRKFRTPQGKRLSAEESPEVRFGDLLSGSARLVLPRGINIEGVVLSASGEPVPGATVIEGTQWGNFKELSRNETDYAGRFWLSNRPPRDIILAASANGHGSASAVVTVKQGMKPVTLQLPVESPLRGRVVNESGEAIANANVQLGDVWNVGLGLKWSDKTGGDGRFVWNAAPTNEVALGISADGYSTRLVRLTASTNEHAIVLKPGQTYVVHVTGTVSNAVTAQPIERFTVKVCHEFSSGIPQRATQTIQGSDGRFDLTTSRSEVAVGTYPTWILLVEADGYDPIATRQYEYEEGDQEFHFQMVPGGFVEGTVRTPAGEPAAESRVAVIPLRDSVPCSRPARFSSREHPADEADAEGHFKLRKLTGAASLIVFHDAGWAVCPVPAKSSGLEIQLLPWARVEGDLLNGESPVAGERVSINELLSDPANPIAIRYNATTDANGHFVFEKLPADEFQVSLSSRFIQPGGEITRSLQTPVRVSAGETRYVRLGDSGQTVVATLKPPRSATAPDWPNTLAILSRDVALPNQPARNDYLSNASHSAALSRYAHDPAVRAAYRQARNYTGRIAPDGIVTFESVPSGKYVLEVKAFSPRPPGPRSGFPEEKNVIAQLRTTVAVPPQTESGDASVAIGTFALEAD